LRKCSVHKESVTERER
jgi:hypothetical protein